MSEIINPETPNWAELHEIIKELSKSQREFSESQKQLSKSQQETAQELKETGRFIRELGKQIGALGNKFGSFTEGLALPAMNKILRQQFNMDVVSPHLQAWKNGECLEMDVLSYANGEVNSVYIVEVKSHLREDSITQLLDILRRFPKFFPEHKGKKLFGMLVAVDIPERLKDRVLRQGLYLARIQDEAFEMETPIDFKPVDFSV
jgi:hypothetical protein